MSKSKDDLIKIILAGTKARNDIREHIKKNKSAPKKRIDSLKEFQKLDGNLDVDGYYGPNSEAALKYYLKDMPDNEVPASHKVYADTEITWKKPEIIQPKQEAVAAKPAAPKPKAKPEKKKIAKKDPLANLALIDSKAIEKALAEKKAKEKKSTSFKKSTESAKKSLEKLTKSPSYGVDEVLSTNNFDAEELLARQDLVTSKIKGIEKSNGDILAALKDVKKRVDSLKNFEGVAVTKKGNLRLLGLIL